MGVAPIGEFIKVANAFTFQSDGGDLTEVHPGGGLTEIREVSGVETRYGLVAILVNSDVWEDTTSYQGLISGFSASNTRIFERIQRYAADVQAAIPWTKTLIVTVDADESTVSIQQLLERLYFEGDPNDSDVTRLSGLVIVGDVPLPVVNKSGHRFISMMPYTDFLDPSYLINEDTQDFERNKKASNLQADIWHGVIVPPKGGDEGMEMLAEYFDKNNSFHAGDSDFATFTKKTYIGDFVTEESTVNNVSFASYNRFLDHWEEIAYYRYTSAMLTDMYADMLTSVESGDKVDNDGDGRVDEEAKNGKDDDGDDLSDEDIGDGFFEIDNDSDGEIDEDSGQDNNNDADATPIYDEIFSDVPYYTDAQDDEDPPGDANGDGCPGACGKDDNGNSIDHDEDGFPTGMEMIPGYHWSKGKIPWATPKGVANGSPFNQSFSSDDEATDYFTEFFVDEDYPDLLDLNLVTRADSSCYEGSTWHGEWDDDEDGLCDEDGAAEIDEDTGFAYNDNDKDGIVDEDPMGMKPEGIFENLPDIQSKRVFEGLVSRYVKIFQQPLGVWNRIVDGTGRWGTGNEDAEGKVTNDYDSSVSLIAKKDEAVLQYLRNVNDHFEEQVKTMVDDLQQEIPLFGYQMLYGTITFDPVDDESDPVTEDICDPLADNDCHIFVNQSTSDIATENVFTWALAPNAQQTYMYGKPYTEIDSVKDCSDLGGTYEDGGQFVKYSSLYSVSTADVTEQAEMEGYKGCLISNLAHAMDDPDQEICFPAIATEETSLRNGAKAFTDDPTTSEDEIQTTWSKSEEGYPACFELREIQTYQIYNKNYGGVWPDVSYLSQLAQLNKDDPKTEEEYEALVDQYYEEAGGPTLRQAFKEVMLYDKDGIKYSVQAMLKDAGFDTSSDDAMDLALAFNDSFNIDNPVDGVQEINIDVARRYLYDGAYDILTGGFTLDKNDAKKISSVYEYIEPRNGTLNIQMADGATPNLPVDANRRISFMDKSETPQVLKYINLYRAETVDDIQEQIETLAASMEEVSGGNAYADDIRDFKLNEEQVQDALDWYHMNIDQKHKYLFTNYLGADPAIHSKPGDGFEVSNIIAKGSPTQMDFSFNGAKPTEEDDLEYIYKTQELIDEALAADAAVEEESYEAVSEVSNTTPIPLVEWMDEILKWLSEVKDSVSSVGTFSGGDYCASATTDLAAVSAVNNTDVDGSGKPDVADNTKSIKLTSEDNNVLQANGEGQYQVSISARKSDGSANAEDSYTQVKLEIVSGDETVEISGNDTMQLTAGVATFTVKSKDPGSFTVKASVVSSDDLSDSNSLSGTVTDKYVKVTTYTLSNLVSTGSGETSVGQNIDVLDFEDNIVATLDTTSGDLSLDGAEAKLLEADSDSPTSIAIQSAEGELYATFYLIPATQKVTVGDGLDGVYVSVFAGVATTTSDGVRLEHNGIEIGLVNGMGQIAISDDYYLDFENPGEINIFDPIKISDADGNTIFEVTIKVLDQTVNLVDARTKMDYLWPSPRLGRIVPSKNTAYAESVIPDTDSDSLDDLEEYAIGTDMDLADSDGDGYSDGVEVFSGNDPLAAGEKLFSDVGPTDESYADIVKLYLRGVIRGYSDGSFKPDNALTREEFLQVDLGGICVACQKFSEEYKESLLENYNTDPFPDTDINPELLYCVAEGKTREIVSGYAGGTNVGYFVPKQYISRAEATKVLVETADLAVASSDGIWYASYVKSAQENGIFPSGRFTELDGDSPQEFSDWFDADQAANGEFKNWIESYISREEFAMMASNLIAVKDCRSVDFDGDGLSDTEEDYIYNTDKYASDTDSGGVNDFDEVVRGTDPNDKSDDFEVVEEDESVDDDELTEAIVEDFAGQLGDYSHDAGVYGEGDTIVYETVTISVDTSSTEVKVFTDLLAADGESIIYVKAEIRDQSGNVYTDDNSSVIKFTLSTSDYSEIDSDSVKVSGGIAETIMTAKTVAGELTVEAKISDGSIPSENSDVNVYAGVPVSTVVSADSTVLPSGGESLDDVRVTLYDAFGNVANYGFHTVTIESEGGIEMMDLYDEDEETEGYQVTTSEGFVDFRIKSSLVEDISVIKASLLDGGDGGSQLSISSLTGMKIQLKPTQPYMVAGSETSQTVGVRVVDSFNKVVTGFQGEINLVPSDDKFGTFDIETLDLVLGAGTVNITVGTLAGIASLIGTSPGFSAGSTSMTVKPADPYTIQVVKEDGGTTLKAAEKETFYADVYDEYGNLVTNDSTTSISLRKTDSTTEYGKLNTSTVTAKNGRAKFQVTASDVSGVLNLVATSTGLVAGTFGGTVNYSMNYDDFEAIEPQGLYTNLLGANYGDVTQSNYIGGYMTFNGRSQVVNTMIAAPKPKLELASIDANGKIQLMDGESISQTVMGAGDSLPVKMTWRSFPDDILQAQIFYVAPSTADSISTTLISTDESFELVEKDSDIYLREDDAGVVKVREDGQIELLDSNYNIDVNSSAEKLSFIVYKTTEAVVQVDFTGEWTADVSMLTSSYDIEEYVGLSPGIYLIPTTSNTGNFTTMPSGNSSADPMGLVLTDPTQELAEEMRPSLGYDSLDKAEDVGTVGYEGDNKNILLFAAGNTAGDSNMYYASEAGILLGDPSVRLEKNNSQNDAGFTEDIGKMVYANGKDISSLLKLDYNGDELDDVLIVYEDGQIDVLQNSKSANRLNNRGTVLYVENKIESVDKGDFNGDELDDLLIVTKTSCLADEMCLYIYENIGGGFVAHNLTLSEITSKPESVKASDLNADGYTDIIIMDENLNLYIIWNNEGELAEVEKINNFGLNVTEGDNLYSDLAISFTGIDSEAIILEVPSEEVTGQEYIDAIAGSSDYSLEGSDVSGSKNVNFDLADVETVSEAIAATKTLADDNGGEVEIGDTLTYTITLTNNNSGVGLTDVYIADSVSSRFEFSESLECSECDEAIYSETGDSARPWTYGPISLSGGASATLSYKVTVNDLPGMTMMIGDDLYNDYTDDDYPDIGLSPEGNNTGTILIYYSDGADSSGDFDRIHYVEKEYSGEEAEAETPTTVEDDSIDLTDADEDGVPDAFGEMDAEKGIKKTAGNTELMETIMHAKDFDGDGWYAKDEVTADDTDLDDDGLNDSIDQWVITGVAAGASMLLDPEKTLDELGDSINELDTYVQAGAAIIEDVVSTFFCNGGCIAMPSNIAFLVPGTFHMPMTGTSISPDDQGIPIFGIYPVPTPPVVCFFMACNKTSIFRFFIAPTTTLGIGVALCVSPQGVQGVCFAFTIPLLQLLGVCDAINGAISSALSSATSFTAGGDSKVFSASASVSAGGDGGISSGVFSDYSPPIITNVNIQVPGFPEAFTSWWKKQKYEFFQMLDLPDITFIYPDPDSLKNAFQPDPSQPELGLKTNILGLQKWLSIANSLPVVNIEPKVVNINYPFLTPEEIELAKKDWQQWIIDAKAEWERFKNEFKDPIDSFDPDLFGNLEETWNENIAIMENNLAILEDYGHIPEDLLKIRNLQAYYAKVIICYLDAVLGFTAGYLGTNAQRIEAWAEWVLQLKNIVKGWGAIIKISGDFMNACDKCTNQRFSAFQIIANLFAFLPDIPVIEMPKWPDIVIDVSNIEAGVDLIWPDLKFVPQTIIIPKIPRVSLPTGDINLEFFLGYNLDLQLPVLPELNLEFETPELPTLSLPNLPDLPPPPAIPKIDATLKASLDIVSTVLKIICLIRSNFFPVQESKLKTKIEEMTERSSSMILPIDIEATVSFPKISLDFVKEIDITTYLKIQPDVTALYDVVNILGEKSNDFVGKILTDFNGATGDLADGVQSWMDQLGEMNLEVDVEAGASAEVDEEGIETEVVEDVDMKLETYNPANDVAYQYKDEPLVAGNIALLKDTFGDLTKQIKDWDEATPDQYELKAESIILAENDPLLHRYDEVIKNQDLDSNFLAQIKDSPLANVVTMRDKMIASVQELDKGTQTLENMDGNNFMKYLAMESKNERYGFVSDKTGPISSGSVKRFKDEVVPTKDIKVDLASDDGTGITVEAPQAVNDGIYIYNEELAVSQKLIRYKEESDSAISLLMFDIDNDSDDDIIYSMGGNVYIKENYLEEASLKYVSDEPLEYTVADLAPIAGNVNNFETGENSYQKASFAFDGNEDAIGYQVLMYDSLDAEESAPNENLKRMLLLEDSENDSAVFVDKDGNEISSGGTLVADTDSAIFESGELSEEIPAGVETTLATFRQSRIYVKSESGSASIHGGYLRTEIDSDGEIISDDSVRFQTLEDTNIELIEDGGTTSINVPALYTIDLPRGENRTIRIESGKVLWVDLNETAEEQDLMENMEIYAEEPVVLSGRGQVTLSSTEGVDLELDEEELFVMDLLASTSNPNAEVELENGAYYTNVRAVYADGISTVSENILLNPQICGDDSSPYPVLSNTEMDIAVFTTESVSAANSFDSTSEIGAVYWDTDDTVDSDSNGVKNDDKDVEGETVDIGPYSDVNARIVTAYIADIVGNVSSATISVNVFVPEIILASADSGEVLGSTDPSTANLPIHLIRDRNGEITELGEGYITDSNGEFTADDLNDSDLIDVYNQSDDTIAQFNPVTKQLVVYNEAYEALALPSGMDWPARLVVSEIATGEIMASFIVVSDEDGGITEVDDDLEDMDLSTAENVNIHVLEDAENYEITDDGFAAKDEFGVNEMLIRTNGNVTMYNSRFELKKRDTNSLDDYLILDLYDDGVLELEIFIGSPSVVEIKNNEELGLPVSESLLGNSSSGEEEEEVAQQYFVDITSEDPLFEDIWKLVQRGILSGYVVDGLNYFEPDNDITRAEFTKIILSILCITPSDEAEVAPSVFNDILSTEDWYFPYTKESFIRSLITGYLGEVDANGQSPFKPNNTITRAEAAKIVLEALNMQEIITLPEDMSGEYWYSEYITVAQDFSEYLTAESGGTENYILTAEEAEDPSHIVTRYEFVEMSVRALNAYNCFDVDSDEDGLTDYEEENTYGTDPFSEDTDKGGITDGDEIERSSDPLDQEDDFPDSNPLDLETAVYAVEEACNSCPCYSSIDYEGDLQNGDTIFAIIQDAIGTVLGKSNELELTE